MRSIKILFLLLLLMPRLRAQETFPYNGVRPKDVVCEAFVNATLFVDWQTVLTNATLVVRNGRVEACGTRVSIPADAVIYDMKGKYIYPAFIDLASDYGMPKVEPGQRNWRGEKFDSDRKGAFGWNMAIRADAEGSALFAANPDGAKDLRASGFATVLTQQSDGIARGTAALVSLGTNSHISLLKPRAAAVYSFNKGSSTQDYPSSLMGSIALLRQTYYDAQWYQTTGKLEERNLALDAFNGIQDLPQVFDAGDKWNILRADDVGDEFNVQYIIRTSGNEYQRIAEIKKTKAPLIVPLNFPAAWDVSDPYATRMVSLTEMKHWELAPSNAYILYQNEIPFCFTSNGLAEKKDFLPNLRKAITRGLPRDVALRALTDIPANLIKAGDEIGALRAGMWASFIVCSGDIFSENTVVYDTWVQGERFRIESSDVANLAGDYELKLPKAKYNVQITGAPGKHKASISRFSTTLKSDGTTASQDTTVIPIALIQNDRHLTLSFEPGDDVYPGMLRLTGDVLESFDLKGTGQDAGGIWFDWTARYIPKADSAATPGSPKIKPDPNMGTVIYPFTSFGWQVQPSKETVLFKNATIWTCEDGGKLDSGQLLISGGKIIAVGKTVDASAYPNALVVDATGMHISPGIIDEHSHIALESVNEGAQTSSAEVREESVVWPEDIDIYRQLSGGVTAAQLLHGSANAIGGQSAIVKMRWGSSAQGMLIENAPGFIKFALGENPKHSAWGNDGRERFPQTRMGVEQVYYDHFIRAREYGEAWKNYKASIAKSSSSKGNKGVKGALPNAPRRDLELEAILEILESKRFVTCHSYVQSEVNMLIHVADSMGFTLNTFTHILEGYKVADKLKAHGAGASSFSDWWAYKWEVKDAIPYNGALLWQNGVTVAFNSDDAEMARRLNQEAAKAVKYGNVPEEEALKFVTLNPAKLLHLDNRMGSIKAGKDADIVVWNNNPLSIYAVAQQTYVDGICYYDIKQDEAMQQWIETERARLIQKMMNAKAAGEPVQQPVHSHPMHFHCDTMDESSRGVFIH